MRLALPKFLRIDPRIAGSLRDQRASIVKGLICVGISSLLTASMIPLTERAIRAISNSAPVRSAAVPFLSELKKELGVDEKPLREALTAQRYEPSKLLPPAADLANRLQLPVEKVEAAYRNLAPRESEAESKQRQDAALNDLGFICLSVVGLFIAKYWFTRGQAYYLTRAANRLAADLRIRLFSKLQRLPIQYYSNKRIGSIQSVLTNDVNVYQTAVNLIRDSIDGPFKAIAALVTIFTIQWQLALIAMLFIPVLAAFVHRNGQKMKQDQGAVQSDLAALTGMASEALSGIRVVKAFAAEQRMVGIYQGLVESSFASQMRAAKRFAQLRPMVELVGAISLATILYICGHLAKVGTLEISQIVALTFALDIINQGARALSNVNNTFNQVQAAADRIYSEVLDCPDEVMASGTKVLEKPGIRIEFRDVCFDYPDGTRALSNVSFVIEQNSSLALVGPSGAGKTTIADLMLRFYDPTSGQILFDGVDIRELDLKWLRGQFGVVPQQTFLFAGSIGDNIMLGKPDATEAELERAADMAHAGVFIQRLPERFGGMIGERGAKVSGGEGQRLAIARAIIREPKILLLDEATSNLDTESERAVTEALDVAMQHRTTLFIAHRLSTAMRATRILVLRRGEVVEVGTPSELISRGEAFAKMYQAYNSGLIEDGVG